MGRWPAGSITVIAPSASQNIDLLEIEAEHRQSLRNENGHRVRFEKLRSVGTGERGCLSCGAVVSRYADHCSDCELREVEQWDYEGSGVSATAQAVSGSAAQAEHPDDPEFDQPFEHWPRFSEGRVRSNGKARKSEPVRGFVYADWWESEEAVRRRAEVYYDQWWVTGL